MKVFVVQAIDIAPDIRLDAGGGELGFQRLLGVTITREQALCLTRKDVDNFIDRTKADWPDWDTTSWSDTVDYVEYSLRYEIEESAVLTESES